MRMLGFLLTLLVILTTSSSSSSSRLFSQVRDRNPQANTTATKPKAAKYLKDETETIVRDGVCTTTACVQVSNNCGVTLYLDREDIDDSNGIVSSVTEIASGAQLVLDISGWVDLTGQRLYAWWVNPLLNATYANNELQADKVEIDICENDPVTMCYNPTAVDYYALPVQIGPVNSDDCSDVPQTGTPNFLVANVRSQCPTLFNESYPLGVCKSAFEACSIDSTLSICTALDATVNQCVADGICSAGTTTIDAYGCAGYFAQQAGYCAAINRGVYPSLSQDNSSAFYVTAPYNTYSSWIHAAGAMEYAFPYDDYGDSGASGYQSCATNFLNVEWCPSG